MPLVDPVMSEPADSVHRILSLGERELADLVLFQLSVRVRFFIDELWDLHPFLLLPDIRIPQSFQSLDD